MLIDLDDRSAQDPAVVGAKAAWLSRGRRAGLPVLPGVVVAVEASRAPIALGAVRIAADGSGTARLAIIGAPLHPALAAAIPAAVAGLGTRLVVRSSSALEDDATWAGAFTSYVDVAPDEVPTAVRGCWASALAPGALERAAHAGVAPADLRLAVLIQPAVAPEVAGTARIDGDRTRVVAVRGSPAPLLQGWEPGVHGTVLADGSVEGGGLAGLVGPDGLRALAERLGVAAATIGATACEWAIVDGRVVLLQLGRERTPAASSVERPSLGGDAAALARLARMARTIRRAPGALGEALVLPWALAEGRPTSGTIPLVDPARAGDPQAELRAAIDLARTMTIAAWRDQDDTDDDAAIGRAERAVAALRGPDPVRASAIVAARPGPAPAVVESVLDRLSAVREGLVAAGVAGEADDAWYLSPDEAVSAAAAPATSRRVRRSRLDPWAPFQVAVVLATGRCRSGVPSGPGLGAGRLAVVDDARAPGAFRPQDVILAPRPIPHLAPLLWDATAIVTAGGGPGAHLFESARAIGLPAVSGVGLDDDLVAVMRGGPGTWAVAVDGTAGVMAVTPW